MDFAKKLNEAFYGDKALGPKQLRGGAPTRRPEGFQKGAIDVSTAGGDLGDDALSDPPFKNRDVNRADLFSWARHPDPDNEALDRYFKTRHFPGDAYDIGGVTVEIDWEKVARDVDSELVGELERRAKEIRTHAEADEAGRHAQQR